MQCIGASGEELAILTVPDDMRTGQVRKRLARALEVSRWVFSVVLSDGRLIEDLDSFALLSELAAPHEQAAGFSRLEQAAGSSADVRLSCGVYDDELREEGGPSCNRIRVKGPAL